MTKPTADLGIVGVLMGGCSSEREISLKSGRAVFQALHEAGIPVPDAVYRKGVSFLLTTQYPDGSWLVRTRAFPVQPYFESGFPFGRHQWISAAGTAWAALAIAATLPDGNPSAVRK